MSANKMIADLEQDNRNLRQLLNARVQSMLTAETEAELKRLREENQRYIHVFQRFQPGGSPPSLDGPMLANWILESMQAQNKKLQYALLDMCFQYLSTSRSGQTVFDHDSMSAGENALDLLEQAGLMSEIREGTYVMTEEGKRLWESEQ